MIRITVAVSALACLTFGCASLNKTVDPTLGTWDHHLENLPQGNPDGSFTISKEGDVYSAVLHGEEGDRVLKEVVIEGNSMVSGHFTAQGYRIDMTGVFKDGTFTGQIDAEGNVFVMTAERRM